MPKLLSINNYHYRRGGSDVVYLEHARLMASRGWENAYFSMKHPLNERTPWERHFINEIEFTKSYSLAEKLVNAAKVIYSAEAKRKISSLLEEFNPSIAHLHCIYHHISPSVISELKARSIPVVMTAHDLKIACPAYKMLNAGGICEACKGGRVWNVARHRCIHGSAAASGLVAIESAIHKFIGFYREVNRIVVPSRFFISKFTEWGWDESKFTYIPNFVHSGDFDPGYHPGKYFLYFGRLSVEKGLGTLIRAAAKIGAELVIVGTGPNESDLKGLAESLNAKVRFLGYQSGPDLHTTVRGAKAVVLPSEWYENAPMSVLEAFALGKPVVGARIGGIPEMIEPDINGWLFESGDADQLADVLSNVNSLGIAEVEERGRAARAMVEREFTSDRYVEQMLALYGKFV